MPWARPHNVSLGSTFVKYALFIYSDFYRRAMKSKFKFLNLETARPTGSFRVLFLRCTPGDTTLSELRQTGMRDAANCTSADVLLQQDMTMGATVDQKKLGLTVQNKNTDAISDCSTKKPLSDVTLVSNSGILQKKIRQHTPCLHSSKNSCVPHWRISMIMLQGSRHATW